MAHLLLSRAVAVAAPEEQQPDMELGMGVLVKAFLARFPPWFLAVFVISAIVSYVIYICIEYAYGEVVTTLAMVESTSSSKGSEATFVIGDDEAAENLLEQSDANAEVHIKPMAREQLRVATGSDRYITSSIRGTIRYLEHETGSRLARVRVMHLYLLGNGIQLLCGSIISEIPLDIPYRFNIGILLSSLAFAWFSMVRTHMIISRPRNIWFWTRAHFGKRFRQILLPTLMCAVANMLTFVIITQLFIAFFPVPFLYGPPPGAEGGPEPSSRLEDAVRLTLVGLVTVVSVFTIALPATMVLTRCQAALLSADETPIIPFDRTFGGRARADGSLSMLAAWKSMDWRAYGRVARINLIMLAAVTALCIVQGIIILSLAELT